MKSVLISIKPQWCELIANGKKTVEVRKTKPKLETPFKCYIYCTKAKEHFSIGGGVYATRDTLYRLPTGEIKFGDGFELMGDWSGQYDESNFLNGKVIGEFVCDSIANYEAELWGDETYERIQEFFEPDDFAEYGEYEYKTIADNGDDFWRENMLCESSCLTIEELRKYVGCGIATFYGWHISDLVIYDKPKELSGFARPCPDNVRSCAMCRKRDYTGMHCNSHIKPPQSWCYVEKEGDG